MELVFQECGFIDLYLWFCCCLSLVWCDEYISCDEEGTILCWGHYVVCLIPHPNDSIFKGKMAER